MRSMVEGRGNQVLHVCKQSEDSTFPGPLHRPSAVPSPACRGGGRKMRSLPAALLRLPRRFLLRLPPSTALRAGVLPPHRAVRMKRRGWN